MRRDKEEEDLDDEKKATAEPRWPMAGAVLATIGLTVLLPTQVRLGPSWLLPTIEGFLLLALVAGDPGRVTRHSRTLRGVAIGLVLLLVCGSLWATGFLIHELVSGGALTSEAEPLLVAGMKVWIGNGLAFCLLFWELDGRGPVARLHGMPKYPDLAFPQQLNPGVGPPTWRPRFADYLYLSFTNSLAFSPTDVMPLVPWAKLAMGIQSVVSFSIIGLVIARAVNVFS